MRPRRYGGTACGKRLGASLVCTQAPASRGGLVDRQPHERMPEPESPRHLRLPDEIELQELVDGVHRRRLGRRSRHGSQLGLERIARHRCAFEHQARRPREHRELLGQRSGDRGRHLDDLGQLHGAGAGHGREIQRSRQLLEKEWIATTCFVERRGRGGVDGETEECTRVGQTQRPELDPGQHPLAMCPRGRRRQALSRRVRPHPEGREHGRSWRSAQQRPQQFDGRRVGPLDVVQHQNQRPRPREPLEEITDRTMAAIALVLGRDLAVLSERPQRWEHVRELRANLVVESGKPLRVQAAKVFIERIDENGERQVSLEFRRRPAEHEVPAGLGASGELSQKTCLADPRFARDLDCAWAPSIELVEQVLDRIEFVGASDEPFAEPFADHNHPLR
jgi:hypothetical protein